MENQQLTFNKGKLLREEELELTYGSIHLRHYQMVLEIDPDGDGKDVISCLHPRLYNDKALDDLKDWVVNKKTTLYRNFETKQTIWVKNDYNTTPKRKKKENIIWDVDCRAETLLHPFGFKRINW